MLTKRTAVNNGFIYCKQECFYYIDVAGGQNTFILHSFGGSQFESHEKLMVWKGLVRIFLFTGQSSNVKG